MPRKSREYLETQYFHIMVQGINKSYIFDDDENAKKYIKLIFEIQKDCDIEIITYCVMSNHCHILVKCKDIQNMSYFMKRINLNYAIYYNKKYNRVGYVFRDRFKSQSITSERQLYTCINYIYNNPVKAKICDFPEEYPYLYYRENIDRKDLIDDEFKFLEIEEKVDTNKLLQEYLSRKKLNIIEILKDEEECVKLIEYFKITKNISYRRIEKIIGMRRTKMSELMKKYENQYEHSKM